MFLRLVSIAFFCVGLSGLLTQIKVPGFEAFFLDWKQIAAGGLGAKPPESNLRIVDISKLKSAEKNRVEPTQALSLLNSISKQNPKAIIFSLAPSEMGNDLSEELFSAKLATIPRLFLFSNETVLKKETFDFHKRFKSFPEPLFLILTHDSRIDLVSRRIITYFDLDHTKANDDFAIVDRIFGIAQSPASFRSDFSYLETKQVYLKIWPRSSFTTYTTDQKGELPKTDLTDKVVIIGTSGIYSMNSVPSIYRRTGVFAEGKIEKDFTPVSFLLANYLTNLHSGEYVKTPTLTSEWIWIFLGIYLIACGLLTLPLTVAFATSTFVMVGYTLLGFLIFRTASINFDTGKVLVVGVLSQYVILSIRYVRYIRHLDKENFHKEQKMSEEKMRSRILVRAASLESTVRTLGKTAHDIRSPLMALQVANSLLKNQVTPEMRDLVSTSISRINGIAEDLFQKYKAKGGDVSATETKLSQVVNSLLDSYRQLHPTAEFTAEILPDIEVHWSPSSIQRSFSNLLNNSLEACYEAQIPPKIDITAAQHGEKVIVIFKDNGPGIPENILPKLFAEGATFGKEKGTGLGLYQIKNDLEFIGGSIVYDRQNNGACFIITAPVAHEPVKLTISPVVILVQNAEYESALKYTFEKAGARIHFFTEVGEAIRYIHKTDFAEAISVVSDLMFANSEETGFDLLDACDDKPVYKKILCTSLVDSEEIQNLADKKAAILVSRAFLEGVKVDIFS